MTRTKLKLNMSQKQRQSLEGDTENGSLLHLGPLRRVGHFGPRVLYATQARIRATLQESRVLA
jgi:hypothetical protein